MVFQGTVSGPMLWNLFFEDARHAINDCFFTEVVYADDLNAYRIFPKTAQTVDIMRSLDNCQLELHKWGVANQVCFDAAKESQHVIGGWGVSPAGPPVTGKSFRVVPCVRTCVRAVLGLVRFQPNRGACSFPFPFYPAGLSLFPFIAPAFPFSLVQAYVPFSLVSTMKKWIQMKSSEFT